MAARVEDMKKFTHFLAEETMQKKTQRILGVVPTAWARAKNKANMQIEQILVEDIGFLVDLR